MLRLFIFAHIFVTLSYGRCIECCPRCKLDKHPVTQELVKEVLEKTKLWKPVGYSKNPFTNKTVD